MRGVLEVGVRSIGLVEVSEGGKVSVEDVR